MRSERVLVIPMIAFVAFLMTGCAGARTQVIAETSKYPVSLSGAVRDTDGRVVSDDGLEHAATFHAESTAWGMLYSAIPLTPTTDISKAVNQELGRTGGDAVVNLKIMSTQCAADFVPILNAIPFWPGCAKIVVEGDIVRVKRGAVHARGTTVATPSRIASATLEARPF